MIPYFPLDLASSMQRDASSEPAMTASLPLEPTHKSETSVSAEKLNEGNSQLTSAFLNAFETPINGITTKFEELEDDQLRLIGKFEDQNEILLKTEKDIQLIADTFSKIPHYKTKLQLIHKDVYLINQKMIDLKGRSQYLKQRKDELLQKEARLMAQPSPSLHQKQLSSSNPVPSSAPSSAPITKLQPKISEY
eukprot:TRINITY_DN14093_c0_g1_i1.p1 TRINITY_DN14093_c0_g1~~TRINITY_DN14093_c0_g1_i1.p1  ORF type:complete len:193 (+),score=45.89 TRINITY_DN14093_c0_g1_i1:3-581(+)